MLNAYPNGRQISYYSTGDGSSTHLVDYSYLGLRTFLETVYTQPDIKSLVGTACENDSDTGDIDHGLGRFGRNDDSYWYD